MVSLTSILHAITQKIVSTTFHSTTHVVTSIITVPPTTSAATTSAAAQIFANSTLDFNVQAGIIAGGFTTSALLILLFVMFLFNFCTIPEINVKETCLLVFFKWLLYKYCACCFKNYRKKLNKEQERLKRDEEAEEMEFVEIKK